jgi:hypothetical protein
VLVITTGCIMQNEALAAKDAELEQASATMTAKVCLTMLSWLSSHFECCARHHNWLYYAE